MPIIIIFKIIHPHSPTPTYSTKKKNFSPFIYLTSLITQQSQPHHIHNPVNPNIIHLSTNFDRIHCFLFI